MLALSIVNLLYFFNNLFIFCHRKTIFEIKYSNIRTNSENRFALLTLLPTTTTHTHAYIPLSHSLSVSLSPALYIVKNGSLYVMSSKRHLVYIRFYQHTETWLETFCVRKGIFFCEAAPNPSIQVQLRAILLFVNLSNNCRSRKKKTPKKCLH